MSLFQESTFEELYASTVRAFPNTRMRQHAVDPIVIESLRWTPFVGVKTLFVKAEARNEDRRYSPVVLIKGIEYGTDGIEITGSDGLRYKLKKPSLENSEILVRCQCADFNWRFNFYDHLDASLYGSKRKKYESKGGPPANPKQMPGLCKHLIKTVMALQDSGLFA